MVDLSAFNTLRVPAQANNFLEINSPKDYNKIPSDHFFLLGHGANVLFTKDFPGTIAKVNFSWIDIIEDTDTEVLIEAGAGHSWHDLVMLSTKNGWWGLQNMALIPGTVGAAAIGNIAAYGGNQEDSFDSLKAIEISTGKEQVFAKGDCQFNYRESVFKHQIPNKYLVTSVRYRLSKSPQINTSYFSRYESLATELEKLGKKPDSPQNIAEAVINLRLVKQPDWTQVGTAGSFFKNPLVSKEKYTELSSKVSQLQWYPPQKLTYEKSPQIPDQVKIPAGRLLDELGWKGKRIGDVSTHSQSALVIVNLGQATGQEIYEYSQAMIEDVKKNFGLDLVYEVQIV